MTWDCVKIFRDYKYYCCTAVDRVHTTQSRWRVSGSKKDAVMAEKVRVVHAGKDSKYKKMRETNEKIRNCFV